MHNSPLKHTFFNFPANKYPSRKPRKTPEKPRNRFRCIFLYSSGIFVRQYTILFLFVTCRFSRKCIFKWKTNVRTYLHARQPKSVDIFSGLCSPVSFNLPIQSITTISAGTNWCPPLYCRMCLKKAILLHTPLRAQSGK